MGHLGNLPDDTGHWKEKGRAAESVKGGGRKLLGDEVHKQGSSVRHLLWAELCPPGSYVEVLAPRISECDHICRYSLKR